MSRHLSVTNVDDRDPLGYERMPHRIILTGGTVIAPDTVYEGGSIVIEERRIAAVERRAYPAGQSAHETVVDVGGQFILPGLVCLHNDAIEKAINPRPFANLPAPLALVALDRALAAAGVTTQFHAITFDDQPGKQRTVAAATATHDALVAFRDGGNTFVDHYVLYRCDVREAASLDTILARIPAAPVRLVSLNDHAPGQGQLRDLARTAERMAPDLNGITAEQWLADRQAFAQASAGQVARTHNALARAAQEYGIVLMSHDDDSLDKVDAMHALGCRVAEFPVTPEAARQARERGMRISMGAPNAVRGGSVSGNASTLALAREGLVDILVGDYHAPSLLHAAFLLVRTGAMSLRHAVATVTATPAAAVGLTNRGVLVQGSRADIITVAMDGDVPCVTRVIVGGATRFCASMPPKAVSGGNIIATTQTTKG